MSSSDESDMESSVNEFDKDGNKISGLYFNYPYAIDGDSFDYEDGQLIKIASKEDGDVSFRYNSSGELTKIIGETHTTEISYEYNKNGSVSAKTERSTSSGDEPTTIKSTYDKKGILTEIKYSTSSQGYNVDIWTITLTYDEDELSLVDVVSVMPSLIPTTSHSYEYDNSGKLTKLTINKKIDDQISELAWIEYSNHKLCYTENAGTVETIDNVLCRNNSSIITIYSMCISSAS